MYKPADWGTVNLGVDVLQGHGEQSQPELRDFQREHPNTGGKQQYNPGRNQELNLPPELFRMHKFNRENPYSPTGKAVPVVNVHERIKELIGEGVPRREAVVRAKQEAKENDGGLTKKEIYRSKYQAEEPSKKISPFSEQVQGYPFI